MEEETPAGGSAVKTEANGAAGKKVGERKQPATGMVAVHMVGGDGLPTVRVWIRGRVHGVKLDTCATFSIAGARMKRFGERLAVPPPVRSVQGLGGHELRVEGVWQFRMQTVYEQVVVLNALVVEGCGEEFLLGKDFLVSKRATINFETNEATYQEGEREVILPFSVGDETGVASVRLVRGRKIPTQAQTVVRVPVEAPDGTVGVFEPAQLQHAWLMLPHTVTVVGKGHVSVPILSVLGRTTKLPARRQLGRWLPLGSEMEILESKGELKRGNVRRWLATLRKERPPPLPNEEDADLKHLDDEDSRLIVDVLRSFPGVAVENQSCPPLTTTGVEHYIPTGDAAPILHRARRKSVKENEIVDENVNKMLQDGVIEMGNGPWGFPVVLVRKKDGSVRFCVDYRALNQVTVKDVYPLPRIDETLESLGGAQLFTTLDLLAGYWQIGVAEQDRDKTAFVTRQGLFRFKRMPFGLSNAPGTFQRLMDCVLRGLLWVCCLVYLDDIIIFTKGPIERHAVELATVLARLEDNGLSIKLKKCTFASTKLEYLGHELSPDGVRPVDRILDAIRQHPAPTDQVGVKRFVHMAGYYRRFVEGFGTKMAPLTRLLRKDTTWEWGQEQQQAFEGIKVELCSRPLLCYPDFALPFVLATDASLVGLGAVLMQDQGKGLQPVGYASKVNSPTQAKYPITELECLAVVWAVKHFRPYLYGRRFRIVTDHQALRWLMTAKDLKNRLERWSLSLQEYDFEVVYRPGRDNVVPDALSRAPIRMATTGVTTGLRRVEAGTEALQLDEATIVDHQRRSEMCRQALDRGECGRRPVERRDGKIMVFTEQGWRTLLPASLWAVALRECHDSIWAGHLRAPQTLARISRVFWWPQVKHVTMHWVASCRDCGSRKVRPAKVVPPLRSLKVGELGDRWALDFAGPLPVTPRGNRYAIVLTEYASKWVIAVPAPTREAAGVARVLMVRVIFQHGPFRELLTDGAQELQSKTIQQLVVMLQAKQSTPVPYRPNLMGLIERYNRVWKDMVSLYVDERQTDWDEWLPALAYAYNSARHTVTGFTPFELMTGREPRTPRDLLLRERLKVGQEPAAWHRNLNEKLRASHQLAARAIRREQIRQAKYYDRRSRRQHEFTENELVWVFRPPKGPGVTKLRHHWVGPCRIVESAGYDNFRVVRLDNHEQSIAHESLLWPYSAPLDQLDAIAADVCREVWEEENYGAAPSTTGPELEAESAHAARGGDERVQQEVEGARRSEPMELVTETPVAVPVAAPVPMERVIATDQGRAAAPTSNTESDAAAQQMRGRGRRVAAQPTTRATRSQTRATTQAAATTGDAPVLAARARETTAALEAEEVTRFLRMTMAGVFFVERRRRRRRNRIGRYALEIEVEILTGPAAGRTRWLTLDQYEQLWESAEDVGDDVMLGGASDIAGTATSTPSQ